MISKFFNCIDLSFCLALEQTQVPTQAQKYSKLSQCHFRNIMKAEHKLHSILAPKRNNNLRNCIILAFSAATRAVPNTVYPGSLFKSWIREG